MRGLRECNYLSWAGVYTGQVQLSLGSPQMM